jgi:hypothetical protein
MCIFNLLLICTFANPPPPFIYPLTLFRFTSLAHVTDLHTMLSTAVADASSYAGGASNNSDESQVVMSKADWRFLMSSHGTSPSHSFREEEIYHFDDEVDGFALFHICIYHKTIFTLLVQKHCVDFF